MERTTLPSLLPVVLPLGPALPRPVGIMVTPFHLLLGNAPMSTLLSIHPGVSPPEQEPAPQTPPFYAPAAIGPSPQSCGGTSCLTRWGPHPHMGLLLKQLLRSHTHSKQKAEMPFHKALSRSHQEALQQGLQTSVEGQRGLLPRKPPTL